MFICVIIFSVILQTVYSQKILPKNDFETQVKSMELINAIIEQNEFQTIILKYDETLYSCGEMDYIMKHLNSITIVENLQKSWPLRKKMNTNIFMIVCLKGFTVDYKIKMESYFHSLDRIRDTKMLFYIDHKQSPYYLAKLEEFFQYCWQMKSINVVAFFKDFHKTKRYYAYKPFPKFEMEFKIFRNNKEIIFPYRLKDLQGYTFYTLPDQVEPRTYLVRNKNGNWEMSGYVGHFINLLVERLNATLRFPFPIHKGDLLFYGYLETLTRNYTIDFAGTTVPILKSYDLRYYTYPFQITNICLMIPLAKNMPLNEIFFKMMGPKTISISILIFYLFTLILNFKKITSYRKKCMEKAKYLVKFSDYILNDVALRGVLGQPFKMWNKAGFITKFIYVLLSVAGLYLSLIYTAFLQTLLTRPLKAKQMKTFEDLQRSNFFILFSEIEVLHFRKTNVTPDFDLNFKTTTYEEFNYLRSHLNTSYAYPTSNMQWDTLFNQQQNLFKDKIFMFSDDACLFRTNLLSFPQAENSIYRKPVHDLIMSVRDHGLVHHWFKNNFLDMLAAGKTTLFDFSVKKQNVEPLKVEDLELVFAVYVVLSIVAILVFIVEKLLYKHKMKCGKTKINI